MMGPRRVVSSTPRGRLWRRGCDHCAGFSLIEVILATAILLGSVVVLGELASMGRRQSLRGRDLAEAQRLCELTLHEVLTGLRPLEPREQEPLLSVAPPTSATMDETTRALPGQVEEEFAFDEPRAESQGRVPGDLDSKPAWQYSLSVSPLQEHPGLAVLTVVVEQTADRTLRPIRFELSRWIEDPFAEASEGDALPPSGSLLQPRGRLP